MISVHFQGKPFSITVIQVYAATSNAEEAEVEQFYEHLQDLLEKVSFHSNPKSLQVERFYADLQELLELTPPKRCPFHYRGLECKSRKSRNTWSNRQIWLWNVE